MTNKYSRVSIHNQERSDAMDTTSILGLYIGSVIASTVIEISNELRFFKDIADAGYKINIDKLTELSKSLNNDKTLAFLLIPIINIFQVFQNVMTYNNQKEDILNSSHIVGLIEEMTPIEKKMYQDNPTSINALLVPLKYYNRCLSANKIKIMTNDYPSEITYDIDKDKNITILKVEGYLSNKDEEFILNIVKNSIQAQKEIIKKMLDRLTIALDEAEESDKDLSNNKEDMQSSSKSNIENTYENIFNNTTEHTKKRIRRR